MPFSQAKTRTKLLLKLVNRPSIFCHYCKKTLRREDVTLDHIVPTSKGGKNTKANLVLSCYDCNNEKGDGGYLEFKAKLKARKDESLRLLTINKELQCLNQRKPAPNATPLSEPLL